MRCPTCERVFPDDLGFCPHDGARLVEAPAGVRAGDALLGTVLDGRYRVISELGAGGFGTVYRGRQVNVDLEVAIKVLSVEASQNLDTVRRFENEAKIISQLRHPNTLKLIDFGRAPDKRLYIITEFLSGAPLDDVLRDGRLEPLRTVRLLVQICDSLAEAHGRGIIHRDLKPANIFLERVGEQEVAKVLDFGIAKISHQTTMTAAGQVMGTPHYMSPEQCRGDEIDPRSDLYSLGVVAYECLSGVLPFNAPTPLAVLLKHIQEPVRPLRSLPMGATRSLDPELDDLVVGLLAKHPDERPESAAWVREALTDIERRLDVRPNRLSLVPQAQAAGSVSRPTASAILALRPTDSMETPLAMPAAVAVLETPASDVDSPAPAPAPSLDDLPGPSVWPDGADLHGGADDETPSRRTSVRWGVVALGWVVVTAAVTGYVLRSGARGDEARAQEAVAGLPAGPVVVDAVEPSPGRGVAVPSPAASRAVEGAAPSARPVEGRNEPSAPPTAPPSEVPPRPASARRAESTRDVAVSAPTRPPRRPDSTGGTAAPRTRDAVAPTAPPATQPAPATLPGMAPVDFGP